MSPTTNSTSTTRFFKLDSLGIGRTHGGGGRALRGAVLPLVAALLALLLLSAGCGKKEESVGMKFDVGKPAPEFTLPDLEGNQIELSSMKGKVLILDFWATWCPPCKEEVPHLVALQSKYRDQGLQIVGLSLDQGGAGLVKPFADEHYVNYTMLIANDETAKAYGGVSMIPTTFVVDRSGIVVKRFIGYTTPEAFEEAIQPLLGPAS